MRSPYLSNPNILAHPDRIVETVALDLTAQETYLAGSPINAEGKLANDETAIGILLYDVRKRAGGKRGVVVVSGRINREAAAAWCGVTISDAAKSALVNITFSDDGARMGAGAVKSVNGQTPDENGNVTLEMPEGGGGMAVIDFGENNAGAVLFAMMTGGSEAELPDAAVLANDIDAAIKAGKSIYLKVTMDGNEVCAPVGYELDVEEGEGEEEEEE